MGIMGVPRMMENGNYESVHCSHNSHYSYDSQGSCVEGLREDRRATALFAEGTAFAFLGDLGEEVVAFVVYEDECGEVFDLDFPDGFHAEFGVFE